MPTLAAVPSPSPTAPAPAPAPPPAAPPPEAAAPEPARPPADSLLPPPRRWPPRARRAGSLGRVPGGEPTDDRDRQHRPQPRVHVRHLKRRHAARGALLKVLAQPALGPHPQPAPGVRAQPVRVPRALPARHLRRVDVRLEIRLLELLARPVREDRGRVVRQPEQRRDLPQRLVLHRGVPQHRLVVLGQATERAHRQRPLRLVHRPHVRARVEVEPRGPLVARRRPGRRRLREHREVLDQLRALGGLRPRRRHPAHRRQQVRPHRRPRPGPAPHGLQRTGEHLGRQVVRGVGVPTAATGVPAHCRRVAPVQLLVRAPDTPRPRPPASGPATPCRPAARRPPSRRLHRRPPPDRRPLLRPPGWLRQPRHSRQPPRPRSPRRLHDRIVRPAPQRPFT